MTSDFEKEPPPAIPVRATNRYKGDTVPCRPDLAMRDESLAKATAALIARLAALYIAAGYPAPTQHGFGMGIPGFHAGGGALPSDLELFIRLRRLPQFQQQYHHSKRPLNIFAIGNSFGYSTLALALTFPHARIAVLDAHETRQGKDANVMQGTNLTRSIIQANALNAHVHVGVSPYDTAEVLSREHMAVPLTPAIGRGSQATTSDRGGVDLVFIDGAHTDSNQWEDFASVRRHLRRGSSIAILHDTTLSRMYRSLHAIAADVSEPIRIYKSLNHCNEFGTALIAASASALPAGFGGALQLPGRAKWNPIPVPLYPSQMGGANRLSGALELDESARPQADSSA